MPRPWVMGVAGFLGGAVVASGAWTAFAPGRPKPPPATAAVCAEPTDESSLEKANANLTVSLQECDRRLAELGEHPIGIPSAASASPPPSPSDSARAQRRRSTLSKEDWERLAQDGVVPVRIPCLRDTPWTPNERVVNRLGLAPSDTDALKQAYEASNKRMNEQIRPLCAQMLGSADAADKVGTSGCIDAINNGARKSNADGTKAALSRVAEVQAGKREPSQAGNDAPPIERLGLLLTKESKTFEDDLAQRLGPDEAKRLIAAPELCTERKTLRAGDADATSARSGNERARQGNR